MKGHHLKKGRLTTNRPARPSFDQAFTVNAHGAAHGLQKVERPNRPPGVPQVVVCPGLGIKGCGRSVDEDMMVAYSGRWICDACVATLRRVGMFSANEMDMKPEE